MLSFKFANSYKNAIIVLLIVIFSKAFLDYSTSGLENPLTNLLLILFTYIYFKKVEDNNRMLLLSLVSSLIMTNRIDCGLLVLPALFVEVLKRKAINYFHILIGFIPFISWELFSLIYYGFPFPNTAYAKLNTGINRLDLIEQGFEILYIFVQVRP